MALLNGIPGAGTDPTGVDAAEDAVAQVGEGTQVEDELVKRPGELWRIEGSLTAVRAEIAQLESLDDAALQVRLAELERRWRNELGTMLSESVLGELHELFDWADDLSAGASELRIGLAQLAGWLDGLILGLGVPIAEPAD